MKMRGTTVQYLVRLYYFLGIGGTTLVLSVFPLYLLLGVMSSFNSKSRSPQKLDDDEAIRAVTF